MIFLSHIYSKVKDVHPIFSTFKSVKTCVERYFHLSRIYSMVKDMHHIFATFKLVETCVEGYFHFKLHLFRMRPIFATFKWVNLH